MLEGKAKIKDTDMPVKMQTHAVSAASAALDLFDVNDCRSIASHIKKVTDVIIHGLNFHHNIARAHIKVLGPGGKIIHLKQTDRDDIHLVVCNKIWIDRNTFHHGEDGFLDVTRGSTDVPISNKWFHNHNKVMLLGHDNRFSDYATMRVTLSFNCFDPRVIHGCLDIG